MEFVSASNFRMEKTLASDKSDYLKRKLMKVQLLTIVESETEDRYYSYSTSRILKKASSVLKPLFQHFSVTSVLTIQV